ncbi:MAG: hypothetical protein ABI476_04725 [Oxalobacteraceae bacterium]
MSKLFKKVPEEKLRGKLLKCYVTQSELVSIQRQAEIRNLSVSTYLLRIALHRRADVKIESEMILAVRDVVTEIRALHAAYLAKDLPPPEEILRPILCRCELAILNVARY